MSFTQKDAAYEQIRWMIVTLQLQPGVLIDEKELTNHLDIGRTPVREALQHLALERLVVILPRQGTYVSEITLTDFDELVEARSLVEGHIARLAAERISLERLAKMQDLLEETEQLGPILTPHQAIKFDRQFHSHIAHACGNKYLQDSFTIIQPFILRLIYFCLDKIGNVEGTLENHLAIFNPLKQHDPDETHRCMLYHLKMFRNLLARTITKSDKV